MSDQSEADAAALRRAFYRGVEVYPGRLAQFVRKDKEEEYELAFRAWFNQFYESIRDTTAGLKLLAELQCLTEQCDKLLAQNAALRAAAELVLGDWVNVKTRDALRAALFATPPVPA
jgi:hypothetical protein